MKEIKNKKNKKIAIVTLSATAGVAAGVAIGTGIFTALLRVKNSEKSDIKFNNPIDELKNKRDEILKFITENGSENVSDELFKKLNEFNSVIDKNSSLSADQILKMLNDSEYLLAFEKIRVTIKNEQDPEQSINDLKKLFKDDAIRNRASSIIQDYNQRIKQAKSKEDKLALVDQLENTLKDLYNEQTLINSRLDKAVINANGLLKDPNFKISEDLKSQIEGLLNKISKLENIDANTSEILADRLENLVDKALNENSNYNNEFEKLRNKANSALENLSTQDLDSKVKENIAKQIKDLVSSASKKPSEENFFLDFDLLNKKLDQIIDSSTLYAKHIEELQQKFDQELTNQFQFRSNESKIEEKYNQLINTLNENVSNNKDELIQNINKLNDSKNKIDALRKKYDATSENIKNLIKEKKLPASFNDLLNKIYDESAKSNENFDDLDFDQSIKFFDEQLGKFNSNIKSQLELKDEIDNQLKDIEELQKYGLNVDQDELIEIKNEFNKLKTLSPENETEFNKMFDKYNELSSRLKDAHKNELNELIKANEEFLTKDYIGDDVKKQLNDILLASRPLADPSSSSTVSQIKPKEQLLRDFLKENQKLQNRNEYNNDIDNIWNNTTNDLKDQSEEGNIKNSINNFFNNIKEEINLINDNNELTNDQKLELMDQLEERAKKAQEKSQDIKEYVDTVNKAIELTDEKDPLLRQALNQTVKDIYSEINNNNKKFDQLDELDVKKLNTNLEDKLKEYQELKDAIVNNRLYEDTLNKINYAFVNERENDVDTPMQTALKNKLNELKEKLDNPNLDEQTKNDVLNQMLTLRGNVDDAHALEVSNNKLKSEIKNTDFYDFGDHKPVQTIESAKDLANYVDNLINSEAQNADIIISTKDDNNSSKLKDKLNEIQNKSDELNKKVAINNLLNAIEHIKPNITDYEGAPFEEINKSIQDMIDESEKYTNENTTKSTDEINDFRFKAEGIIELAQSLKNIQDQIKTLKENDREFILDRLTKVALENKINPNDSFATIQEKNQNIRNAITQINDQIKAENALKELENVYPSFDSVDGRKIYQDEENKTKEKLEELKNKYRDIVNDDSIVNKNSELISLVTEINKEVNNAQSRKDAIDKEWNDKVSQINDEINKFKEKSIRDDVNATHLSKITDKFNQLIDDSNKKVTTLNDLDELKSKIAFEYAKDELDTAKRVVEEFMQNEFSNDPAVAEQKAKYQANIQKALDDIYNNTTANTDATKEDYDNARFLINQIKDYAANTSDILKRIKILDEDAKKAPEERKYSTDSTPLKDAMDKNQLEFNPQDPEGFTSQLKDLKDKTQNIKKAYQESLIFDDLKNELLAKISQFKDKVNENISEQRDDSTFKSAINATIDKIKEKVNAVRYDQQDPENSDLDKAKNELITIENDLLNNLQQNIDKIQQASESARLAQNAIDQINATTNPSSIQTKFKDKLNQLAEQQRQTFNGENINYSEIDSTTNKINSLILILNSIKEFDSKYTALEQKIQNNLTLETVEVTNQTTPIRDQVTLNPTESKNKINNFKTQLREQMDAIGGSDLETINTREIFNINKNLTAFISLIDNIISKIAKYNSIKNKTNETAESSESKIYQWSAKYLGDSIIKSALVELNYTEANLNSLSTILDVESATKERIFNDRVEDFKYVVNNKTQTLAKFDEANKQSATHNELKDKLVKKYDEVIQDLAYNGTKDTDKELDTTTNKIKDKSEYSFTSDVDQQANQLLKFSSDKKQALDLIHNQVNRYIQSADLINSKILAADQAYQTLKNNTEYNSLDIISAFITRTEELVKLNKDAWVVDVSPVSLTSKLDDLDKYILRIDLLNSYSKDKIQLAKDITANTITAEEAKPLEKIITNLENEINAIVGNRTLSYYDSLKTKYLTGNADTSLKKAKYNTIKLKEEIVKAEKVKQKYLDYKNANSTFVESTQMQALYTRLDQIIEKAKANNLNIETRSERDKERSIFDISDSAFGIIAELQDRKYTEAKETLLNANKLNDYMTSEYSSITVNHPKLNTYEQNAINGLSALQKPSLTDYDAIGNMNTLITKSLAEMKSQKTALFDYERKLVKISIDRSKLYRDLFKNGDGNGYSSDTLRKIANVTEQQYNSLDKALTSVGDNVNIPDEETHYQDENYKTHIVQDIRSKKIEIDNAYNDIKRTSRIKISELKLGFDRFKQELTTDGANGTQTLKQLIASEARFKDTGTETLITDYTTKATTIPQITTIETTQEEQNADFNNVFNKYRDYLWKLVDTNNSYQNLLYKDSRDSLKTKLDSYIENRKDANTLLNFIASTSYNTKNKNSTDGSPFKNVIDIYDAQYTLIKNTIDEYKRQIDQNSKASINEAIYYLSSAYKSTIRFRDWLTQRTNFATFFRALDEPVNNKSNTQLYNYSEIKEGVVSEDFIKDFETIANSNTEKITIDGQQKTAVLVNNRDSILNYFNSYSIVKSQNSNNIFNPNTMKVYIYKNNPNDKWFDYVLQTDTRYKNIKYNMAIIFDKTIANNSIFGDIPSMTFNYPNVQTRFKTIEYAVIDKSKFPFEYKHDDKNSLNTSYNAKSIFKYDEAGWSESNALSKLLNDFYIYTPDGKTFATLDYSTTKQVNYTKDKSVTLPTGPLNDTNGMYFNGELDGTKTIGRNSYTSDSDIKLSFISTYSADNHGNRAWLPVAAVLPVFKDLGNGKKELKLYMLKWQFEPGKPIFKENTSTTDYTYSRSFLPMGYWQSESFIISPKNYDNETYILSSDSVEQKRQKVLKFANIVIPEMSDKREDITSPTGRWTSEKLGDQFKVWSNSLSSLFKELNIVIKLNKGYE